ncbi:MAG TPA: heme exporter protein CcmD [Kiloniellales bacterium]
MSSFASFLEMGGYGGFVWPAFALTAAVLLALLVDSLRRLKSGQRTLARLEAESPQRRSRGSADAAAGGQA